MGHTPSTELSQVGREEAGGIEGQGIPHRREWEPCISVGDRDHRYWRGERTDSILLRADINSQQSDV